MIMKLKQHQYVWVLLILACGITSYFYGKMLLHPNEYVFKSTGDGLKNYYTYAYHIKHDTSATEVEAMNYPYGENFLYTDNHP